MSVVAVVQARTGSTRLPGKVLMDLGGVPLLEFMLRRLRRAPGIDIVVATSTRAGDDAVERCARDAGVAVVRGDEGDVLERFRAAVEAHPADHVVRLTADCPLIDPNLVEAVIIEHLRRGADYTSNTIIRTHPDGLDVEVMRTSALLAAAGRATDPAEREHVTPYLYRRPGDFALAAVRHDERYGHLRWTVDTVDDLEQLRTMVASGDAPDRWTDILAALPGDERRLLTDGWQPTETGDDPADRQIEFCVDGVAVGSLRLVIGDDGSVIEGSIPPPFHRAARAALPAFLATSQQLIGALP